MHRVEVYRSKSLLRSERWRWRLVANNGKVVAHSGEGYTDKVECERMALRVVNGGYAGAVLQS